MQEHVVGRPPNRYFPDQQTPPEVSASRPSWAKGVELRQEDLEKLPAKKAPAPIPPQSPKALVEGTRRDAKWAKALAASKTKEAFTKMLELMSCGDPKIEFLATKFIWEAAWGKPKTEVSSETATTVTHVLDPGALHQRLTAVVRETTAVDESHLLGARTDPDPAGETE
jgi:hypothetical protein